MNFCKACPPIVIRFILLSFLSILLILSLNPTAIAQLPSISDNSTSANQKPLEVRRYGEIEITRVKSPIDNRQLIEIASPTVYNRNQPEQGKIPVELRAQEIQDRIWRYVTRLHLSKKTTSQVTTTILNNQPIIQVQDNLNSRPLRLITVTESDADYAGKTVDELAKQWQKTLQGEINRMEKLFSPEVLLQRLSQAFGIFLGMLVATGMIWFLRHLLKKREKNLLERYQAKLEQTPSKTPESFLGESLDAQEKEAQHFTSMRSRLTSLVQHQLSLKRRLEFHKFLKWALFWLLIVIWYLGVFKICSLIPILMRYQGWILATPLQLVIIWFFVSLGIRISKNIINRLINVWENTNFPMGEVERKTLRSSTIFGALEGLVTALLILIGLGLTLNIFKVSTSSILAGGAIIGLAVSFGAQNLVKDLVNGCLILVEDQFAVGDVVTIGSEGGFVENLNLRITQLRNGEGQLITIPNSSIVQVKNLTRLWSRVDFTIEVAYENDPKQVLDILSQIALTMYDESEWRQLICEPPEVLGIDNLSHNGMLVRVWIKTLPMEQWSVGREYRYRVRVAFEKHNIQIGRPQWITYNTSLINGKIHDFPVN